MKEEDPPDPCEYRGRCNEYSFNSERCNDNHRNCRLYMVLSKNPGKQLRDSEDLQHVVNGLIELI